MPVATKARPRKSAGRRKKMTKTSKAAALPREADVSIRGAVLAEMKRRKWTVYEVWTNTLKIGRDVPRTVVYGFLKDPQERNISLPHAENLLASLGISLLSTPAAPAAAEQNGKHK
jgi:hypothetical protein